MRQKITDTSTIKRREYLKDLRNSMYCYSPFGWEKFAIEIGMFSKWNNTIKRMSHVQTWPDLYIQTKHIYLCITTSGIKSKRCDEKIDSVEIGKEGATRIRHVQSQDYGTVFMVESRNC